MLKNSEKDAPPMPRPAPSNDTPPANDAYYGYERVSAEEKTSRVKSIFSNVAGRYDLMNDLMSGGLHHLWKNRMVSMLAPRPGRHYIDVAGGTGDIAFRTQDAIRKCESDNDTPETGSVTVCDINPAMLAQGKARAIDQCRMNTSSSSDLRFLCASAESIPLPESSLDGYTIAFGIRNVGNIDNALGEAYRLLKPGSHFLCLEFSPAVLPVIKPIYDMYSEHIIPWVGERITGDRAAYQYLVDSIRTFPAPEQFSDKIRQAGFKQVMHAPLTFGIVAIHSGWKC